MDWYGERAVDAAATEPDWRKWLPSDPTSAHFYDSARFVRLLAAYVAHDADRGRERTVREFVAEFDGLTSTAKQTAVLDATGFKRAPLSALVRNGEIDAEAAGRLLATMRSHSKPVKPRRLGLIGKEVLRARLLAAGCKPESFTYKPRLGETDGIPWVQEVAFGHCPKASARRLVTGVNWSPGIVNPFRELGRFGQSLDEVLTKLRLGRGEPVVIVLHLACPRVEYTDRGKSAVVIGGWVREEEVS